MKICSVEGCERPCYSRGCCGMHYSRLHKHGDPNRVDKSGPKAREGCSIPGCGNKHSGLGFCRPHYNMFRRERPQAPQDENMLRQCKKCAVEKPLKEFIRSLGCLAGRVCKKCISDQNKKIYREDPVVPRKRRLQQYGLSLEDYDTMHAAQKGVCGICKLPEPRKGGRLSVDHCHKTGKVRGLLCHNCNHALGNLKDSIPNLNSAIDYLKRSDSGTE